MHYKWPLTGCGGGGEGGKHLAPIVMVKKSTDIVHIIRIIYKENIPGKKGNFDFHDICQLNLYSY